ncbi:MAG TPA: RluA family pseudouridine synthase [Firmicutes bacterium]|nr:RluA family pseudouridine synthase [Bacillota bacterium]
MNNRFECNKASRLDEFLAENLSISRSQVKKKISSNLVLIDGTIENKAGRIVKLGQIVEIKEDEETLKKQSEYDFLTQPFAVLFEDDDLFIINKKRGVVVHPSPGHENDTLVNYLIKNYSWCKSLLEYDSLRPGIVHRIDKDTSGVLIIAKNINTFNTLKSMVKNHEIKRDYLCLVKGHPKHEKFMIDANIDRDINNRKNMKVVSSYKGRNAITHFVLSAKYKTSSLLSCSLETGRTHQIRVHLDHFGYPIIGDQVYGKTEINNFKDGQLLHAYRITLIHPTTKKVISIYAPLDEYFKKAIITLSKR